MKLAKKSLLIQENNREKIREKLEEELATETCYKEKMALKGAALQNYNTELVHRMMQHPIYYVIMKTKFYIIDILNNI